MDQTKQEWWKEPKIPVPFREGVLPPTVNRADQTVPKPVDSGWHSIFIPSALSIPACSTQPLEHMQSPLTPMSQAMVKVATAYEGLGVKESLPPTSLLLFPVLRSPPLLSSKVLFLFLPQGLLQMLKLPDRERRHSWTRRRST